MACPTKRRLSAGETLRPESPAKYPNMLFVPSYRSDVTRFGCRMLCQVVLCGAGDSVRSAGFGYFGEQIQEYIKMQLEEDQIADQMSLKEFIDPFIPVFQ